jgi:hypothetical protein
MLKCLRAAWIFLVLGGLCLPEAGAQRCGVERWAVKTGTDGGASQVDLANPQATTIADLIALPPPSPLPGGSRFAPAENTVFVVNATLTDYKLEGGSHGDSDYHLVLQDEQGNTLVAEIPSPNCVGAGSPFAAQISSTRAKFDAQFSVTSSFQTANTPVRITGVGFFDFFHNQHGAAPNVVELHPVLDIDFSPQAASGDFAISVSSPTMHLHGGGSSSINVNATPIGGPNLPAVTFSASGLPAGVSAQVTPSGGGKATLLLSANFSAPSGTFPVVVTGVASGRSHSQAISLNVSGQPGPTDNQQWEYKVITAISEQDVIDQANQLGAQDWEMVGIVRASGSPAWRAFFKRAKRD